MASVSGGGLAAARRIVVKVGSALVVGEDGPDRHWLGAFAADLARVRARGQQVLVVSSGAVALGRRRLSLPRKRALTLPDRSGPQCRDHLVELHRRRGLLHRDRRAVLELGRRRRARRHVDEIGRAHV